ncbi:hypothetical protein CgunFtcFv8_002349 [Champsocephalus gunnari]|uniref:Uncharacterized protein n=1 Tax=Champsocephalus gunnari TaxID=52237 RepID=A0AAN8H8Z0_CHAGU|nr:hypothetical protein CgunFtcFv8_002349 [Champsocephalus gunnari]
MSPPLSLMCPSGAAQTHPTCRLLSPSCALQEQLRHILHVASSRPHVAFRSSSDTSYMSAPLSLMCPSGAAQTHPTCQLLSPSCALQEQLRHILHVASSRPHVPFRSSSDTSYMSPPLALMWPSGAAQTHPTCQLLSPSCALQEQLRHILHVSSSLPHVAFRSSSDTSYMSAPLSLMWPSGAAQTHPTCQLLSPSCALQEQLRHILHVASSRPHVAFRSSSDTSYMSPPLALMWPSGAAQTHPTCQLLSPSCGLQEQLRHILHVASSRPHVAFRSSSDTSYMSAPLSLMELSA